MKKLTSFKKQHNIFRSYVYSIDLFLIKIVLYIKDNQYFRYLFKFNKKKSRA